MQIVFLDQDYEDFYWGKDWNRKKLPFQENILRGFQKCIQALYKAKSKKDLVLTRALNFEELQGKRRWEYSLRINKQRRVIFIFLEDWAIQIVWIKGIEDYH